jgi:hypothetical protein
MANAANITRRTALIGALASSAALAVPAIGAMAASEHPNDKVRRLGKEMAEALRDPRFVGFNRVTVTPDYIGYTDNDPETRIAYAKEDIRLAIAEQHPDWKFQVEDRQIGMVDMPEGIERDFRRRGIVLYASDERYGPEQARFWVDYPSEKVA